MKLERSKRRDVDGITLPPMEHHRMLTAEQYAAKGMLIAGDLVYDRYTHTYRGRSPEGSNYTYSRCIDADTLEPVEGVVVRAMERLHFGHHGKTNSVTEKRMGLRK